MRSIEGLENHPKLKQLLEKIEKRINENDAEDAGVNMRKVVEYITQQYMRENEGVDGDDLFSIIKSLQEKGLIYEEQAGLFHKIRMAGNAGGAHLSEESSNIGYVNNLYNMLLDYIPEFLDSFPVESKKPIKKQGKPKFIIDYSKIKPIEITNKKWREVLSYSKSYSPNDTDTRWCYHQELIYKRPGDIEMLDMAELVRFYVKEIEKIYNAKRTDPEYIDLGVTGTFMFIPGIVQEYLGCSFCDKDFLKNEFYIEYDVNYYEQKAYELGVLNPDKYWCQQSNIAIEEYEKECIRKEEERKWKAEQEAALKRAAKQEEERRVREWQEQKRLKEEKEKKDMMLKPVKIIIGLVLFYFAVVIIQFIGEVFGNIVGVPVTKLIVIIIIIVAVIYFRKKKK